ncbi:MAG: cob(I)yrinic acid a,c-diamide adenosyltransferase [Endomicrobium sp.]|jgi:cob(I)alamin adenosyltransferase|nr:cob(I)yrinic acid a,c-diamide adenosyltransferase [Endomicrobium sp.]
MLIVNTGNGKGKTTAAVGQIIRSLGHGFRVCLIQLFKGCEFYGEQKILSRLDNFDFFSFAERHPYIYKNVSIEDVKIKCRSAVDKVKSLFVLKEKYDLVVLEEFNIALRDKFIDEKEFICVLKHLSEISSIVVTGRGAPQSLLDIADIVTEMKEIKHWYNKDKSITPKKGIEY